MLLRERDQKRFSQLLKTLTNSLPDDDSEYSVFDYYVDESGEWDVWQSKLVSIVIRPWVLYFWRGCIAILKARSLTYMY